MKKIIPITSAQILALNATPITLIAAPGANQGIIVKSVLLKKSAGTAYDGIAAGEDLTLKYENASGAVILTAEATGFLDSAVLKTHYQPASGVVVAPNKAVVLHMATGEIATGTCTLSVEVEYDEIDEI